MAERLSVAHSEGVSTMPFTKQTTALSATKQTTALSAYRVGWKPAVSLLTMGLAATLSLCSPAAHAQILANKADAFLTHAAQTPARQGWTSVIVRAADPLTEEQQRQLRATGADIYRHLPIIHSVALRVPTRHLSQLAALPFVQHLSADVAVKKNDQFTVGSSGASVAWQQNHLSGYGVTVAVLDSGVHFCNDLAQTVREGNDLLVIVANVV